MLTDRQQLILRMVVDDYIRFAEPIGSRSISKRGELSLSPATIRNEMSDLEELGYLEQPHTSAGRIPSQKGYRFYVDHLMRLGPITDQDVSRVRTAILERIDEMEKMVQQCAQLLSSLTNYASIVLGQRISEARLMNIQLVPLSETSAVVIMVTDTGHVEHRSVQVPEGLSLGDMTRFVRVLNDKLHGLPINQVKRRLQMEVGQELQSYMERFERVQSLFDQLIISNTDEKLYLGGTAKMLSQPEFQDVNKVRSLLDVFETNDFVSRMLHGTAGGIEVRIGLENDLEQVHDCSIVTATYSIDGKPVGKIGILGPTRMDYGRVITLLDYVTSSLSEALTRLHK